MIAHNVTKIFVRAFTPQQQKDVWGVRVVGLGVLQSMRGDSKAGVVHGRCGCACG